MYKLHIHVCQCALMHMMFKNFIIRNLGLYIVYMYYFNNASYDPCHEKISLLGLRPGLDTKQAVQPQKVARDFNLILRRKPVPLISHLHNEQIKTAFYKGARFIRERKLFAGLVLACRHTSMY